MVNREGLEFDLRTVRFLRDRWQSELGIRVKGEVLEELRRGAGIRGVLGRYVLDHQDNASPYEFPYYPPEAMHPDVFWVLHEDDLRGIELWNEDLSSLNGLEKANVSYAKFYHCTLNGTALSIMGMTHARFHNCSLVGACFAQSGGLEVEFSECDLTGAEFIDSGFENIRFTACNLSDVYLHSVYLDGMHIDHATQVSSVLRTHCDKFTLPYHQIPDILRDFRRAYSRAEIWDVADRFYYAEMRARRKYILRPSGTKWYRRTIVGPWVADLAVEVFFGYGIRVANVLGAAFVLGLLFAALYFLFGTPAPTSSFQERAFQSVYFSFATFTTLGYGDLHYSCNYPWMRLLSTFEACVGAVMIASIVAVLARKHMR